MANEPYGFWKSPITSDLIVAESIGLSEVRMDGADLYWLELRPREGGRNVVVRRTPDGRTEDVTPAPYNVRTRVHEYGGGAWAVAEGVVYFSHYADQRLYRLERGEREAVALTPEGPWRYGDGILDERRARWIGVREDHSAAGREPANTLVSLDATGTSVGSGQVIAAGHDFYSSPRLAPDGRSLAFLAWDHPNMPWMGTTLYVVALGHNGLPAGDPEAIAGGREESIFQPEWTPDGALLFVSDRSGWWNLYRRELAEDADLPLAPMEAEFGQPQWVFGMATYAVVDEARLVCSYISKGLGALAWVDARGAGLTPIDTPFTDFYSVRSNGAVAVFRAGAATAPSSIARMDLASGEIAVLKRSAEIAVNPDLARYFTHVRPVEFPTESGLTAFGLYYPAHNPDYQGPAGERPPLVVKCHGGPTSAATSTLDLRTQYWTSRGIAVLDVNYGGSTGYGRAYRKRLDGNWGVVDVDDCVNGARYLAEQGLVDGARSVITGGSAGGYTTLAALTFRDFFRGGASHYGVSDIAVLVRDTHKFEARYEESLVGPYPECAELYRERSPLTYAERLSAPVIFFQGDEDLVVPPNQTELMVEALRRKGTPVGYLLFAGEQHGFRKAANIQRALDAELAFYAVNVFRCGLRF